jgi:hypothetical protein
MFTLIEHYSYTNDKKRILDILKYIHLQILMHRLQVMIVFRYT